MEPLGRVYGERIDDAGQAREQAAGGGEFRERHGILVETCPVDAQRFSRRPKPTGFQAGPQRATRDGA